MTRAGRHANRIPNSLLGLILLVIMVVVSYLAYTKELPFQDSGYELHARFDNAATLRADSPVRIAGINVGKVTSVESAGDAAEVTFTVDEEGLPIHDDAQIEIRPRLFLEGNFFLDVQPGSPSAPDLPDGGMVDITQTSTAVQLDEVLTALQSDSRTDLQKLLKGYGTTLTHEPTPAEDADQDQDVQGETAAESLNDTFAYGGPAGRDTAIVQDALHGQSEHDLSGLFKAQRDTLEKLVGHESQLQGLITNLNITTGALASEQSNLAASIRELAPTLEEGQPSLLHLSNALPPLRAFARAMEPSVAELPGTIRAGMPWLGQAKLLLRDDELGGLARLLGDAAAPLARTSRSALELFPTIDELSRCVGGVLEPTGSTVINDGFSTGEPNFHEFFFGAVNQAGVLGNFDGNGPYQRIQSGGGDTLLSAPNPHGQDLDGHRKVFGNGPELPGGVQPVVPSGGAPPFKTSVPCYQNDVPDVNGPAGAVAPPDLTAP